MAGKRLSLEVVGGKPVFGLAAALRDRLSAVGLHIGLVLLVSPGTGRRLRSLTTPPRPLLQPAIQDMCVGRVQ